MIARRLNVEQAMLDEVGAPLASIERRLGDELIAAARDTVSAWYVHSPATRRRMLRSAIMRLEELVGRPE